MSRQRPIWWQLLLNIISAAVCFQSRYSWNCPSQYRRRDGLLRLAENNQDCPTNGIIRRRPIRRAPSPLVQQTAEERQKAAQMRYEIAQKDPNLLSDMEFTDPLLGLSPVLVKTLTQTLGLVRMTEIQARTFAPLISGKSVLGRARTGTGKTLAFLLPIAQRLVDSSSVSYQTNRSIGAIIVAPTRELAVQIAKTAELLIPSGVQCIHGGTNIQKDRAMFNKRIPTVLVATPGRLVDHLEQKSRINRRLLAHVLADAEILVLDEADRLIQGFPFEVRKILSSLPRKEKRQTILFSATVPKQLKALLLEDKSILPANHEYIDCIGASDDGSKEQNNLRVEQTYHQLKDMKSYIPSFVAIVNEALLEKDMKVIAFLPTTKMVDLFMGILQRIGVDVWSIHSRMSHASRNLASTLFRQTKHGILLTSDVSARGVDYPDVNLVIQYGAPLNYDLYFHRLGRCGRAGAEGRGLLVLLPFESRFLTSLQRRKINLFQADFKKEDFRNNVCNSGDKEQIYTRSMQLAAEAAYISFVAHYLECAGPTVNSDELLNAASDLVAFIGLKNMPTLPRELATKLGV